MQCPYTVIGRKLYRISLIKSAEAITAADLEAISDNREAVGLLPRLLKVKCPVDVILKDSDGNIIAYESVREGAVYPEVEESGVFSWISNDNEKVFFLPFGCEDVTAEIEAYDYGTMNVSLETIGAGDQLESMTYTRDNVDVTLVDDGETPTWRIHRNFHAAVYDVGVKVGSYNWYYTERVFELINV